MRIRIIRKHDKYELGEHDVTNARGAYLIAMGAAEIPKKEIIPEREKVEVSINPEKREYKRGRPKKIR